MLKNLISYLILLLPLTLLTTILLALGVECSEGFLVITSRSVIALAFTVAIILSGVDLYFAVVKYEEFETRNPPT